MNAMLVSLVHDIGYELIQVRTGENGLKKPHRAGAVEDFTKGTEEAWRAEMQNVLKLALSGDGERKRANLLKIRERVIAGWQEGGETMNEFRSFLACLDSGRD